MHVEENYPIPPVYRPFKLLSSELKIVKEIVTRLPQRPGESSSGPVSYVPQHEFNFYLRDQMKCKSQSKNLDKAYTGVSKSHSELSRSHNNMKKWEKSRDMLFIWIWKGVKGLCKVLKVNYLLPTSQMNEVGSEPTPWSDNERHKDIEVIRVKRNEAAQRDHSILL